MPSLSLSPADASKLAKLCGMFSSDYDGERANAAQMADSMLRKCGVSWDQVFQATEPNWDEVFQTTEPRRKPTAPRPPAADPDEYGRAYDAWHNWDFRSLAKAVLDHPEVLYGGEERFLRNLLRQSFISQKQRDWLTKIAVRCELNVRPNS